MLAYEEIEALAKQFVGTSEIDEMTVTQRTIFRILMDFGLKVAVKAEQHYQGGNHGTNKISTI